MHASLSAVPKHLLQALLWFKSPPRYFARCTRRAAAEQVAALDTFMLELQRTLTSGVGSSGAAGDLTWPSYRTPAAAELGPGVGGGCAGQNKAIGWLVLPMSTTQHCLCLVVHADHFFLSSLHHSGSTWHG